MTQKLLLQAPNIKMKKQKHLAKLTRQRALEWLANKFPEAFDNTLRIRPLKIGIMTDILSYADEALSAGISKTKLREAVVLYTRRIDYLTCLKVREHRIDLFGNPVEIVSEEDAERASLKIKKRIEKASKHALPTVNSIVRKTSAPTTMTPASKPAFRTHQDYTYNQTPRLIEPTTPTIKAATSITIKRSPRQIDPIIAQKLRQKLDLENT